MVSAFGWYITLLLVFLILGYLVCSGSLLARCQTVQNLPNWLVVGDWWVYFISLWKSSYLLIHLLQIWTWLPQTTGLWVNFIQELKFVHPTCGFDCFFLHYCLVGSVNSVVFLCMPAFALFLLDFYAYHLKWLFERTVWWISLIQNWVFAHPFVHLIVLKFLLIGFNFNSAYFL